MFIKLLLNVFILLFGLGVVLGSIAPPYRLKAEYCQYNAPDTLGAKSVVDSVMRDSLRLMHDTLNAQNEKNTKDTIVKTVSPNAIDEPITYTAVDSIRFEVESKKVYLFGNAFIKYKDIELKAAYIELSLSEDEVYAKGTKDSTGKAIGQPEFKQADQAFDAVEITYNFKTKKGIIKGVVTKPDGGFLHSDRAKKQSNNEICIQHGKFTTCDLPHPHFYIALTKAKVIPDKKIISGPAYLVIADIPVPLGIPFGYFPNKKGSQSGVIIPQYGEEKSRGFFLRNGGYYFAINDYFDLTLTGDIYANLSWGANFNTKYRKRYKFSGNLNAKLNENFFGEKGDKGYQHNKQFAFTWTHSQDPKARPNSTFSANVNASSSSFDRYNNYDAYSGNVFTNNKMSNISYSKTFPNSPFGFSLNLRHSQNSTDSTIALILPDVNMNMSRIFPFRSKSREGQLKWYENIGLSYASTLQNKLTTKESKLFTSQSLEQFQKGIQHSIPISTSLKAFKYFTISPGINYTERWYFNSIQKNWDSAKPLSDTSTFFGAMVTDTVKGFYRVYDYNLSASISTTIYGMYQFKHSPVKAIRHVLSPSVTLSYRPDFGADRYGYYKTVMNVKRLDNYQPYDTLYTKYSMYEGNLYGTPGYGKSGLVNFSLGNTLEMKVKSKNDTVDELKKVRIFDGLNFSTSYNIAADSLNWSPLNISGSTNMFQVVDLRFSGILDPYVLDSLKGFGYTRVNKFTYNENSGKIGRLTTANMTLGITLDPTKFKSVKAKPEVNQNTRTPDGYAVFRIPWSLNISYNLRYDKPILKEKITQTLSVSGGFSLTPKWMVRLRADYDFVNKKLVNASVDISRDLHCWEMSFNWVPFGFYQSYFFRISVKSAILQDLKLERRRNWMDNLDQE